VPLHFDPTRARKIVLRFHNEYSRLRSKLVTFRVGLANESDFSAIYSNFHPPQQANGFSTGRYSSSVTDQANVKMKNMKLLQYPLGLSGSQQDYESDVPAGREARGMSVFLGATKEENEKFESRKKDGRALSMDAIGDGARESMEVPDMLAELQRSISEDQEQEAGVQEEGVQEASPSTETKERQKDEQEHDQGEGQANEDQEQGGEQEQKVPSQQDMRREEKDEQKQGGGGQEGQQKGQQEEQEEQGKQEGVAEQSQISEEAEEDTVEEDTVGEDTSGLSSAGGKRRTLTVKAQRMLGIETEEQLLAWESKNNLESNPDSSGERHTMALEGDLGELGDSVTDSADKGGWSTRSMGLMPEMSSSSSSGSSAKTSESSITGLHIRSNVKSLVRCISSSSKQPAKESTQVAEEGDEDEDIEEERWAELKALLKEGNVAPEMVEKLMRLTLPKEMASEVPGLVESMLHDEDDDEDDEGEDDEDEEEGVDKDVDAALAQGAARKKKKRSKLRRLGTKFKKGMKSSVGIKHIGTTETITKLEEALVQVHDDRAKIATRLQAADELAKGLQVQLEVKTAEAEHERAEAFKEKRRLLEMEQSIRAWAMEKHGFEEKLRELQVWLVFRWWCSLRAEDDKLFRSL
jgi:hypothetical protein